MHIGLQIPYFHPAPEQLGNKLADVVRFVDENGFYSLWVMDHLFQMEMLGKSEDPMLEGYTMLGYFAGLTQRVKLGAMVTGVIPAIAKPPPAHPDRRHRREEDPQTNCPVWRCLQSV